MTVKFSMTINGKPVEGETEDRTLLVQFIREHLRLTGTHVGCDTTQCGCCTVHLDGIPVKSCTMLAVQADGCDVTTIEGLAKDGELHPMQRAFLQFQAVQCGYCIPGMILSAVALVNENPDPSDDDILAGLAGNLCRCTGYAKIIEAVHAAADEMKVNHG